MKLSSGLAAVSIGALLLGATAVSAAPVSLQVCSGASCWNSNNYYQIADGVVVNWSDVQTMINRDGGISVDTWETNRGLNLESWSLTMDSDPFVTNNFTLTNTTGSPQTYSVGVSIGVAPAIPNAIMRGSIGFSMTDNNSNGATLTTSGISIYRAQIDGNTARTLWDPVTTFSTPFGTTGSNAFFGFPMPELAPESVDSNIGLLITFSLTGGDSVAFTSNFEVMSPAPIPPAVWLFASGALGLFGLSRRKSR